MPRIAQPLALLLVALVLHEALHDALAMQVAPHSRPRGPFTPEEHKEAERLVKQIEDSIRAALPDVEFSSSFTAEDLLDMAPPSPYTWDEIEAATRDSFGPMPSVRGKREAEEDGEEGGGAHSPDEDVEEVADAGCGDQPPATGLRRWVIRIRNIMFGRRDLEASEGGEAEGEPEEGRTWAETLAHWFAHGIKRVLIRIGGGEEGSDLGADSGSEADDGQGPAPAFRPAFKPTPTTRAPPATSGASSKTPSAATAKPWLPPMSSTVAPKAAPTLPADNPSGIVYDDETFDGKPPMPVDETNELS